MSNNRMSNMFHNSLPTNSSQWDLTPNRRYQEATPRERDGSQTPIPQLTSGSPMAKIIDIGQKMPRYLQSRFSLTSRQNSPDEDQEESAAPAPVENWSASNTRTSGHQQAQSGSQQQVNELSSVSAQAHKQQSGETLSSFESDYDLLVYLGETETEDIIDTERSLDYQDQTWRQSICGASLAPTIDESLSELTNQHSLIIGGGTLERQPATGSGYLLADPLSASHSPFATPSPARSQQFEATRSHPLDSDECDNEVSFVMHSDHGPTRPSISNKYLPKLAHHQQQQQQLSSTWQRNNNRQFAMEPPNIRSATMGRERPQETGSAPGDELDKLLAEMSQSLDLDSLARYDPQPQRQRQLTTDREKQPSNQKPFAPTSQRQPQKLDSALPVGSQLPAASGESILDEFDGASRMLEQMISDQLKESVANRQRRQRGDSQSINSMNSRDSPRSIILAQAGAKEQLPPGKLQPQQRSILHNQRPQRVNKLSRGESQSEQSQGTPQMVSRKVSSCSSSVASTVLLPANSRNEQSGSPISRRLRRFSSSGTSSVKSTVPPPPPKVDYVVEQIPDDTTRVTQLEPDELPAPPSSSDEDEITKPATLVALPSRPPPPPAEVSGLDRMKRRTLSSMRSMRNKLSDLMPKQHNNQQRSHQTPDNNEQPQRPPRPPKRSSSIGSRSSVSVSQNKANLVGEAKQVRESRSTTRRGRAELPEEKHQSFGQQLRERLSRSKSRFTRFLKGANRRSKSQPSRAATFNEPQLTGADEDKVLIGPGDIARNSANLNVKQGDGSSSPSSFNRSLDRHLAADMAKRRESSSASSLSGLDLDTSAQPTIGDRSRHRMRRKTKSPRNEAPRPLSVISLASRAKRQQTEPSRTLSGSASVGASPAPARRAGSSQQRVPTYFGPAYSLMTTTREAASSERRSSSQDELANANIWQPRNISGSQKKRSQSMKSVRLFTPRQVEAGFEGSDKAESQTQLASSNRRLPLASNSFRPASALAGAQTLDQSKVKDPDQGQSKVINVRSLAATPIGLNGAPLDGEQRQLSLEPASRDENFLSVPGEPARLSSRAKSAAALFVDDIKQKCSGLFTNAQQQYHTNAPVAPPRRHRRSKSLVAHPQPAAQTKRLTQLAKQLKHTAADFFHQPAATGSGGHLKKVSSKRQPETSNLCEWKPVIASGRDTTTSVGDTTTTPWEKGTTSRAPALKEIRRMQSTFDTNDTTWESLTEDETGSYSRQQPKRRDSSDSMGQTGFGKLAEAAVNAQQVAAGTVLSKQQVLDSNNNNNIDGGGRRTLVATDDGDKCGAQKTPVERACLPLDAAKGSSTTSPNKVALDLMANNDNVDIRHSSTSPAAAVAKQTFDGDASINGVDVERRRRLVDNELDASSTTTAATTTSGVENRQQKQEEEIRICETPFKFNANLPKPAEIFSNKARNPSPFAKSNKLRPDSLKLHHHHHQIEDPEINANEEITASEVARKGEEEMTSVAAAARCSRGSSPQVSHELGDADARFLKAISERRQINLARAKHGGDDEHDELEESANKRLSVYENEPMSQSRPPFPPVKPARPSISQQVKVPDSPVSESWSVGEVDTWSRRAQRAREEKCQSKEQQQQPPANSTFKPQLKRLTTMTSIIQDPMDELMNAPSGSYESRRTSVDGKPTRPTTNSDDDEMMMMTTCGSNSVINKQSNSDSDSSMAAAPVISVNRRRMLQEKFASPPSTSSKQPAQLPAQPRAKCPAFNDGGRASGGSLVKRLAKNFDQVAAACASSEPARGKSTLRSPLICDEEKSEASQWFDAASGTIGDEDDDEQQLDEAELAELLAEFEAGESKPELQQQQQRRQINGDDKQMSVSVSEDVSTGADPFVTVADSTLELAAATDSACGADDTLNDNDEDGVDDEFGEGRSPSPLADEVAEDQSQPGEQHENFQRDTLHPLGLTPPHTASPATLMPDLAAARVANEQRESVDRALDNLTDESQMSKDFDTERQQQQQQLTEKRNNKENNPEIDTLQHPKLPESYSPDINQITDLVKPIDNILFKNSLNNIIAQPRRFSQPTTSAPTTEEQPQPVAGGSSSGLSSSASPAASPEQKQATKTKTGGTAKRGLARYYRALLGKSKKVGREKKVQIDSYIHSSSGSSASSSPGSSSGASSRSGSPTRLDRSEKRKESITGNANSSAELLYEELERMLARRLSAGEVGSLDDDSNESKNDLNRPLSEDQESLSSSNGMVSAETIPELRQRQNLQKLYHIVNEIYSSESKFVDTLKLLNVDFRRHMDRWTQNPANSSIPGLAKGTECIQQLLKHLPQLQALNESLLDELGQARDQWPRTKKIAHVLVKIGPFLKHYSTYIREFDSSQQQLTECQRKLPQFAERIKEFETSERCQKLTLQHHLLRPIQRIPQYRLLLQQYLHHLKPDEVDYEDTVEALEVVSRVAEHANQSMNEGVNFAKLLALQAKIVGKQRDIVQPGRLFVKEGELMKVCRKQVQPRWFVLLNDALLYLTQIQSSDILYLNNELPLDDCLVSIPNVDELVGEQFETEFSVQTRTRSFALIAKSRLERDEWVEVLRQTIDQHQEKRRSFQQQQQQHLLLHRSPSSGSLPTNNINSSNSFDATNSSLLSINGSIARPSSAYYLPPADRGAGAGGLPFEAPLGHKAPLWTPDSRVTMCQLCTSSFSALFRRHHCRACGRVVCSACSANKAPLVYLKCRAARVCDQCFEQLKANLHLYYQLAGAGAGANNGSANSSELRRLDDHFRALIKRQFKRHGLARRLSNASSSNSKVTSSNSRNDSGILREVGANDSNSLISGYLHRRHASKPKWKRQWFVIRERVLYAYRAIDDVASVSTLPLVGYQADQPASPVDGLEPGSLIRLTHKQQYQTATSSSGDHDAAPIQHLFKAESIGAAERWLDVFKKSVVFETDSQANDDK